MAKANTPGRKQPSETPQTAEAPKITPQPSPAKKNAKGNRPQIGGTAVAGAKSTLPKTISTSNNQQQQQMESSNRTMRRRMQSMNGNENDQAKTMQDKRRKRIERRKERLEERRTELRKSLPNKGQIKLGRKNLYFILAVVAVIILLVLYALLRQWHVI